LAGAAYGTTTMANELTPAQINALARLINPYFDKASLEFAVSNGLNSNLENYSLAENLPELIFQLCDEINREGRISELIEGLKRSNPNPTLHTKLDEFISAPSATVDSVPIHSRIGREAETERSVLSLVIEKSDTGCRIVASFEEKEREIEVPMLPDDVRLNLPLLQDAILRSPAARRPTAPISIRQEISPQPRIGLGPLLEPPLRDAAPAITGADDRIVQEIGSALFDFVFPRGGRILDLYSECYQAAKDADSPLWIRLCVTHPDLSWVPWETLYDKQNRFYVTTSQYTPFARCINPDQDRKPLSSGRPIRILGMAARVKTLNGILLDAIEVDEEQANIKKALGNIDDGQRIKLCWVPSAQSRDLNRGLARGDNGSRWDIFHFIGHGGYDESKQMGYIVVQEEGGPGGARLYAEDLRNFLIQPGRTPNLVVLNSCSGAQSQPGALFSSVAADLIQGGVPAVVAMQFAISDNMGIAFSNAFYSYLADGNSIERALTHTRANLKANGFSEWICPVLYMRTADGELFKTAAEAGPPTVPPNPER
jgi:hypothetical protein